MKRKKVILVSIIATSALAVLASYLIMEELGVNATHVAQETAVVEEGQQLQPNEETETVVYVTDTTGVKVPVPKGYVASKAEGEHTVSDGFVIYEGKDEVNDENKDTAQKERNQWVWVPINNPYEIYGIDKNGELFGKLYGYNENGRGNHNWEEGYGKEFSFIGYEPCILGADYDSSLPNHLTEDEREIFERDIYDDFEEMIESVKKYGGFYIGRYETGNLSSQAKIVKGNTDINNQTWYTMYEKSKELGNENENVETSMIWGCLWDATLGWLVDTKHKSYKEVGIDSTNWGNFIGNSFTYTSADGKQTTKEKDKKIIIPTGSAEIAKANNIYDLAGNVGEWTLEGEEPLAGWGIIYRRIFRSGSIAGDGYYYDYTADYRANGDYPDVASENYGTRAVLYIAM